MFRFLARAVLACSAGGLACGCSPQQADIEKGVRDDLTARLGAEVATVSLTKQPNGGYEGTATAANGDVYDVAVDPPRGGRVQWRLSPAPPTAERIVRAGLEARHRSRVKSLELARQPDGTYAGPAVLEDGTRLHVKAKMTGKQFEWEAEPAL